MFTATLSQKAKAALAILGRSGLVKQGYLAGGSALALHYGHRQSIDFDFFSQKTFRPEKLSRELKKYGNFQEDTARGISLIGTFNRVKFSYFRYDYPLLAKTTQYLDVNIAHPYDIAAMKMEALMNRGTKKDFVDIYELISQGIDMEQMFDLYDKKYKALMNNRFSLIKSLGYFVDAQESEMPIMIKSITWTEIRQFFTRESLRLARKYLK